MLPVVFGCALQDGLFGVVGFGAGLGRGRLPGCEGWGWTGRLVLRVACLRAWGGWVGEVVGGGLRVRAGFRGREWGFGGVAGVSGMS